MCPPAGNVPERKPHCLFLRHWTTNAPSCWSMWGKPVIGNPGVWLFPVKDHEHLLDLLEVLIMRTPPHEARNTMAMYSPYDTDGSLPLSVFSECQPLPALHARLRNPWLMGDLSPYVRSFLQPIVDLVRGGQVFAHEALCRICTPDGRVLSGDDAFTLGRRAHKEETLDLACIRSALRSKANLLKDSGPIFINVMPHHLLSREFLDHCRGSLDSLGLSPQEIVFELIESERVNPEALVDVCDSLRGKGFRIALDDVGAGYNGLATLATLHPDFVKLDRQLVHGIQGSRVRMLLMEALISMSQRLGCATIAEGLERMEDILLCQEMGINYAQGYYFARPAPEPAVPSPMPPRKANRRIPLRGMIRLADYVDLAPALPVNASVEDARELFDNFPELQHIIILDDGNPIGYVPRLSFKYPCVNSVCSQCQPTTRLLKDRVFRSVLARRICQEPGKEQPWIVVDDDSGYLGTIEPWVILSQMLSGSEHEELHPLSLLPTGPALRSALDLHLQVRRGMILVYIDMDYFKAFNDRYGFIRGDAMIKLLAEIIRQERGAWPDAHMGHIGGDDFIIMLPQEPPNFYGGLKSMIESFHRLSAHLYDARDLACGCYETEDGYSYPVAALSIIVVNGSQGPLSDSLKAGERAAQLKKLAKTHRGSVIVVEGNPPAFLPLHFSNDEQCWQDCVVETLRKISQCRRDRNHHDLDDVFKAHPYFELVYELDADGVQRYPNWVNPLMRGRIKGGGVGMDRSEKAYFEVVRDTTAPYVSGIYLSTASEDFCVTVSVPLWSDGAVDSRFDGALVADINLPGLVHLFKRPESETNGRNIRAA